MAVEHSDSVRIVRSQVVPTAHDIVIDQRTESELSRLRRRSSDLGFRLRSADIVFVVGDRGAMMLVRALVARTGRSRAAVRQCGGWLWLPMVP